MLELFIAWADSITQEQYLWWSRLQCLGWTAADVVIVVALTRLVNAARTWEGRPPHLFPYLVLGFSLMFAPLVIIAPTGRLVFFLELLITMPHFALILYLLGVNHAVLRALAKRLSY